MSDADRIVLRVRDEWLVADDEDGVWRWRLTLDVARKLHTALGCAIEGLPIVDVGAGGQG